MTDRPILEVAANDRGETQAGTVEPDFEAAMSAIYGLWDGDLRPLTEYLKACYRLSDLVRRELVAALQGKLAGGFYKPLRLQASGKVGSKTPSTELKALFRQLQLYDYSESQMALYNGNVEAVIAATMEAFGVSRSTVTNARKAANEWLNSWPQPGRSPTE